MRRLALVASFACSLVAVACDDDDPITKRDAGRDTGTATDAKLDGATDATTAVMCTGSFASVTKATLRALTPPAAKCGSDSDIDLACTGDLAAKVRQAGLTCLGTHGANTAAVLQCVVAGLTSGGLSMGCAGCYAESVACTLGKCMSVCVPDPNTAGCLMCQQQQGCLSGFATCSGLPVPGASTDGGAGDAAKLDGSTDGTPDAPGDGGGTDGTPDAGVDAGADASPDVSAADTSTDVGSDV
jgi:hypothetical protein